MKSSKSLQCWQIILFVRNVKGWPTGLEGLRQGESLEHPSREGKTVMEDVEIGPSGHGRTARERV